MAVKTKRKTTAGPPWKEALPMAEKMPAPMMAAMPKAVRSTTPSDRRRCGSLETGPCSPP